MSEPIGLRDNEWRNAHRYTGHGAALSPDEEFVRAVHYDEAIRRDDLAAERERELVEALRCLLKRDQRNTCPHEETYRGGHLWEICSGCGMKWADDEGGKPEWTDPPEWDRAEQALAAYDEREGSDAAR